MKVTKRQLRQIIREEKARLLEMRPFEHWRHKVLISKDGVTVVETDDELQVWVDDNLATTGYYDNVAGKFVFYDVGDIHELQDIVDYYNA